MSFYEHIYPYFLTIGWIAVALLVGTIVTVASVKYLDYRLASARELGDDRRVEFSFCLGGVSACAIFLTYATLQLWSDLGTPFNILHSVLTLLWVASLGAIWWLVSEIRDHASWVRLYLREYPRQTA